MPPAATIVIPTYNASSTVGRSLASIVSDNPLEIIVVDDCSADLDTLRAIATRDPRVRLVEKPQRGNAAESRAQGLALAAAETVLFLDADDAYDPGHVDRRVALHRQHGAGLILGRFRLRHGDVEREHPIPGYAGGDVARYIFLAGGDARSSALSVHKPALRGATFDSGLSKHQDWGFAIAAQRAGAAIGFDDVAGVVLHIAGPGRMSGRSDVTASVDFMTCYLQDPEIRRAFLIGRLRTSIRIGDLGSAVAFRALLLDEDPTARQRLASLAFVAAARLGIARSAWRLLSRLRQ